MSITTVLLTCLLLGNLAMPASEREIRLRWVGPIAQFMRDSETRNLDLEGAFRSGKTTAALWKVYTSCQDHPGINWLVCRYSDGDTDRLLRPLWRDICLRAGTMPAWSADEHCWTFSSNGSRVYMFGLKAQDQVSRYAKLRGLTLAGIYVDQAEELPKDVYDELDGRLSQPGHPHQLIITPNPPDENHWIATAFPESNHIRGHRYIRVSVYDNAHNLSPEYIRELETTFPPGHSKHRPAVLGLRGLNVIGKPVYGAADPKQPHIAIFQRRLHERSLTMNPQLPLCESWDFGKHHPCVVWGQYTPYGELHVLGGVMGQSVVLEDFVPIVLQQRAEWFPGALSVRSCCDPAGSHSNSQGLRKNGVTYLREQGVDVVYKDNSNALDVRNTCIERIAGYMRRRSVMGEAFGVDDTRWVLVSSVQGFKSFKFVTDGFEAGYVWDEHFQSVSSKQMRRPKKDGWYEHGQNCLEYLELNFGGAQPTQQQVEQSAERQHQRAQRRAQQDPGERFRWAHIRGGESRRGGY